MRGASNARGVAQAFIEKKALKSGACKSDGISYWSYGLCVATWNKDGIKVWHKDWGTVTTSRHISALQEAMSIAGMEY